MKNAKFFIVIAILGLLSNSLSIARYKKTTLQKRNLKELRRMRAAHLRDKRMDLVRQINAYIRRRFPQKTPPAAPPARRAVSEELPPPPPVGAPLPQPKVGEVALPSPLVPPPLPPREAPPLPPPPSPPGAPSVTPAEEMPPLPPKKVAPPSPPAREGLLEAIKKGVELKKPVVEEREILQPSNEAAWKAMNCEQLEDERNSLNRLITREILAREAKGEVAKGKKERQLGVDIQFIDQTYKGKGCLIEEKEWE